MKNCERIFFFFFISILLRIYSPMSLYVPLPPTEKIDINVLNNLIWSTIWSVKNTIKSNKTLKHRDKFTLNWITNDIVGRMIIKSLQSVHRTHIAWQNVSIVNHGQFNFICSITQHIHTNVVQCTSGWTKRPAHIIPTQTQNG